MKKLSLIVLLISVFMLAKVSAQDNVGIGTTTPDNSAILDLDASDKGLLAPRVTLQSATNGTNPVNSPATGLLVYNTTGGSMSAGFYYWDGTQWTMIGSGGASCVTLDEAYDCGGAGAGRSITADNGAVEVTSSTASAVGMLAKHTGNGVALAAINNNTGSDFAAFEAASTTQQGTQANPKGAVLGSYTGSGDWSAGLMGQNTSTAGDAHGIIGIATSATAGGIYGSNNTTNGFGVIGNADFGVFGQAENINGGGVVGQLSPALGATQAGYLGAAVGGYEYAVFADNDILFEQYLDGAVGGTYTISFDATTGNGGITGTFSKGGGSFKIDHPLDPQNKYLYHSFVESPDMMNIYNGNEVFDSEGFAKVTLPKYFDALNKDFRYQLTPIGAPMPNIYVAEEISGNTFVIGGGTPGKKVSWQVTGVRQDKFANENRIVDEVEKEDYNKGRYLHPTLFGAPKSQGVHLRNPEEKGSENTDSKRINRKSLDKDAKADSIFE